MLSSGNATLVDNSGRYAVVSLFAFCGVFVSCAFYFAAAQAIWIDETTQLSGLTLGFSDQIGWLSGSAEHPFSVPPDRMPPLSYWVGKIWAAMFGLTEMSLRGLGIAMAVCAVPALFGAGRLAGGALGGVFAVAYLLTSPDFVIQMVEIRAYPIVFCLSAWATYLFMRLVTDRSGPRETRDLVLLTGVLVAMSYTHFYGIVASAFLFIGLLAHRLFSGRPIGMLAGCCAVGTVALAGVLPFALAAVSRTGSDASPGGLSSAFTDTARLVFRLVASQVHLASPILLGAAGLAILVFSLCLLWGLMNGYHRQQIRGLVFVIVPIVAGLIVLTGIRTQVSGFPVLASHYNLWLFPLVSVALAFAFALQGRFVRRIIRVFAAVLILAQLAGLSLLMTHRTLYTHGPGEVIADTISDPVTTVVVLDAADPWGAVYFPVSYLTKQQATQWLSYPDGSYRKIVVGGLEPIADPQLEIRRFSTVLRVQTAHFNSRDLAAQVRGEAGCIFPSSRLFEGRDLAGAETFCAYTGVRYVISAPD